MMQEHKGNGASGEHDLDWSTLRHQLDAVSTQIDEEHVTPEVLARTWAKRAARFAEAPVEEDAGEQVALVIVRLGRELFGIEARYVFRIRPMAQVTRVPRVPSWIMGVANERGRVLSVFDLRRFLELPAAQERAGEAAQRYLVIVESEAMDLALLADEVLGIRSLALSQIQDAPEALRALRGVPRAYVRGVVDAAQPEGRDAAQDATDAQTLIVLDLATMLADERLVIREEQL